MNEPSENAGDSPSMRDKIIGLGERSIRKNYYLQLQQQLAQALAAARAKDHLLAAVSHELRTPLMPIMLLASTLEADPELPESYRQDMTVIRTCVELEKRLIDDLLDFAAISSGKITLRFQDVNVHSMLRSATEICRSEIDHKQLDLRLCFQADRDAMKGDPERLYQIFWNLLLNSVKFTPPHGHIEIQTQNPEPDLIQIRITDTGRGIDSQTLSRLFHPFEQGPRTDLQHYGGLGLGLAIARILTEGHHGTIEATSTGSGCGSTFTLRFPLATPSVPAKDPSPPPKVASVAIRSLRILLVEDHDPTRQILVRLLQLDQHTVFPAVNIAEALVIAARDPLDLVISDIGLPDGSGLDLMIALQKLYQLTGIAISGYASENDRQSSLQAGFVEHLCKPVSLPAFHQAIQRAASRII